ncbi:uncharacterized protein EKO05_0000957 [Ascochyta rabiei]|uniref:Uncharacterized protein n=1 Tax=Didymella rabiei TaxID=5454 RepID=A0A163IC52_DIDRA|nr:uncharacterized protein EKO05_0000957 [Ascochyta rabiei]KZM25696.1 hypothetical protein ST47_g3162 [Ascochyta rabiei]UPX10290.1 hypothetical protein EKO05_0000957 [Ascochyta rabiei]
MSSLSMQPFRFLDLPGELRNNIYDLLLCSWDDEPGYEPGSINGLCKRSPSYDALSLLRTNKQIHEEAFDYMMRRNQFVRVTCRGLDVNSLFLGDEMIPAIATDQRKARQFEGYLMHLTLSKPVVSSGAFNFSEHEIMMLRADLPFLCRQLDVETAMTDANATTNEHLSISATVSFSPFHSEMFTPATQQYLLDPIASHVRGISNLSMSGPVSTMIAEAVISQVAQPRWTDPKATLDSIHTGTDVGKRQWQNKEFYSASESWTYSMRTLERMRHSSSWLGLKAAGGEDFVNSTADLYFTLNLLRASFLQVDMASEHADRATAARNGAMSLQHLRKCETASARFAQHADATWVPSNEQASKMLFRQAKCLRLMHANANLVKAVTLIEQAAVLAPNDIVIRDEKDAVRNWEAEVEELQRERAQAQADKVVERASLWSYLRCAVSELAS